MHVYVSVSFCMHLFVCVALTVCMFIVYVCVHDKYRIYPCQKGYAYDPLYPSWQGCISYLYHV